MQPHAISEARPDFRAWAEERQQIEAVLDATPEEQCPALRERLFDRSFELERKILTTPTTALDDIMVKANALIWLMQMDGSDGLTAIEQIRDYLARLRTLDR